MRHLYGWFMHDQNWRLYEIRGNTPYINGREQSFLFYERWRSAEKALSIQLINITDYDIDELSKGGFSKVSDVNLAEFTPYPDNLSEIEAKLYEDKAL